jgi:hypothetical protein
MELLQQEIVRIFFGVLQIRKVKEKVVSMVVESSQSEDVRVVVSPYRICPLGAHIDHQVMFASSLQVHKMKAELNFQDDKTPPPHCILRYCLQNGITSLSSIWDGQL